MMIRKWLPFTVAIVLAVLLAITATTPPAPKGTEAPATQFSAARAMKDVRIIAAAPHATGTPENKEVRDYLADRLTALGMDVRISESQVKEILGGFLRMLGVFIIGIPLLLGLNILSGGGDGANYYDRLAAIPKLEALAFFASATVFFVLFGSRPLSESGRFGAMGPILLIGVAGQIVAPTATYFISLPIMLCAIASLSVRLSVDQRIDKLLAILIAALIVGYVLGLGHLLMLGVGPDMLAIAALPTALSALGISSLYPGIRKQFCRAVAVSGLFISVGIALWIRLDPIAATVPTY